MADEKRDPEVLLTRQHIHQWMDEFSALLAERVEISKKQEEMQHRSNVVGQNIQMLHHRLLAVAPFYPSIVEWLKEQEIVSPDGVALTQAILRVLQQIPNQAAMNRLNIQQLVPQFGYPAHKLQANQNYMNIALKRLVDRRLVEEFPASSGHYRITDAGRTEIGR
jgi:hypothetical protein